MADHTPTRRSGRARKRNHKYTDDLFETLDLAISDGDDPISLTRPDEDAKVDEDFNMEEVIDEPEMSAEEVSSAADSSEGSAVATLDEAEDDEIPDDQLRGYEEKPKRRAPWKPLPEFHSKGLSDRKVDVAHGSQKVFLDKIIGTSKEDAANYRIGREKWGNNISLPSKQPNSQKSGGMAHPVHHTAKQRETEATVGWDWYYLQGGKDFFAQRQKLRALRTEDGTRYVPQLTTTSHGVLMGPYGKQKLFSIPPMQSLNIDDAWAEARAAHPSHSGSTTGQKRSSKRQDGYVLNIGSSIQCLEWAPNHEYTQYLAISTISRTDFTRLEQCTTAPAYTPLPGPSSIQVWALSRSTTQGDKSVPPPELRLVICTEWGYARQLEWCPMPRKSRLEDMEDGTYLGLLAGIWADGCVRVLDVHLEKRGLSTTQYIKYETASFEAKPADALCTCVDWLSPTDIAVGCSNGYVAIWNIFPEDFQHPPAGPHPQVLNHTNSDSKILASGPAVLDDQNIGPSPYFYTFLHSTYILAICCAYPTHPQLIATSSSSGFLRLTDIRSPASDYVLSHRTHWAPTTIFYSATLSSFVAYEEGGYLKLFPIRRFWSSISFGKGDNEVLSLAVGSLHPTVLAGFADGSLLAVNPARRFVEVRPSRAMFQHRIWKHEWARQKLGSSSQQSRGGDIPHTQAEPMDSAAREPSNQDRPCQPEDPSEQRNDQHQATSPKGISRITEAYKIEIPNLTPIGKSEISSKKAKLGINAPFSTIYDKETGVRAVAWNPNEAWGGWAASGMGSGLIRIEDLAI